MHGLIRTPALLSDDALCAPMPGWFRCTIAHQTRVSPGDVIGELNVLGRIRLVTAPNVRGLAHRSEDLNGWRAVGWGDVLLRIVAENRLQVPAGGALDPTATGGEVPADSHVDHLVFRAPTSGRFFSRPSPDKPPFVSAGTELKEGHTVCLLEVMKTFHRVSYSGAPARVRSVVVEEGAEVTAGTPLLELE